MGIITFQDFSFTYPKGAEKILNQINLEIKPGSFTLLCGISGCGKSTLLRQMKTILQPNGLREGEIYFEETPLAQVSQQKQSAEIGYVMQDPDTQIVTDKVWHELAFGLESLGMDTVSIRIRVAEMASYFGIQQWFHKNVEELSGGQKQILNLASVMTMHPKLLILDEPTSQLDPIAAADFLETVYKINRDLGTTVLMTEHRLQEVFPMADRVVVMDDGGILTAGAPKEVGAFLYEQRHPMFQAAPIPMQIFFAVCGREAAAKKCPLTIRDGREWVTEYLAEHLQTRTSVCAQEQQIDRAEKPDVITVEDVWFRYDKQLPDVVKGAGLHVKEGELYCLLGGNGTGKSTLLSLLCRVQRPYRGTLLLYGKKISAYRDRELYQECLGVVPQNPQSLFVKKTVRLELYEMIDGTRERMSAHFPIAMEKKEVVKKMAELMHLTHCMDAHPFDLSGGEQQRLALAKILLLRPKILLMDEPTKGLDGALKQEFAEILQVLKQHGVTIFMVSHDIEFCAAYSDYCGMFFDGAVVAENVPAAFFRENSFYTTAANRMMRHVCPQVVTKAQAADWLKNAERGTQV